MSSITKSEISVVTNTFWLLRMTCKGPSSFKEVEFKDTSSGFVLTAIFNEIISTAYAAELQQQGIAAADNFCIATNFPAVEKLYSIVLQTLNIPSKLDTAIKSAIEYREFFPISYYQMRNPLSLSHYQQKN